MRKGKRRDKDLIDTSEEKRGKGKERIKKKTKSFN
jgi:hypothetical protein